MAGTLTVQNIQGPSSGANANKIIIPAGQTLDTSSATLVPSAGQIVQVLASNTAEFQSRSTSAFGAIFTNSAITITPKYSDSLIFLQAEIGYNATATTYFVDHFKFYDVTNSSDVAVGTSSGSRNLVTGTMRAPGYDTNDPVKVSLMGITTSGSTTSRTYDIYHRNEGGANRTFNYSSGDNAAYGWTSRCVFTIMEIKQ